MIIEKNFTKYLVYSDDSISIALKKINENKSRICYVVKENGFLLGVVTDGDVRRWLTNSSEINLNSPISNLMNKNFVLANFQDSNNNFFLKKLYHYHLLMIKTY